MTTDTIKEMYNKFEEFPDISYNCIEYMMNNNELIWKLLKYNDKDAWKSDSKHPNLTKAQKGALIYDGSPDDTSFRIFFDIGQDNSWTEQACILRITPIEIVPKNHVYGNVSVGFQVYSHYKINQLSNYKTRLNIVTQQLISVFNGQEVGGLGRLYFDARANSACRMTIGGQIPYKANNITMCNWVA